MIYFFDNELNMVKVTTSKNVISAVHEHELNGLILGTVETDLSYTEAFINDVDYFGYYYKDNYYLHKIKRVEHEHENELVKITGRHIFFEDMLYGDYIRDVRPVNRDALYILNQTISVNTRWQTVMTDTSKLHSETYYWVPPMEVLNDLTENVGIEYEPKILFDGQNINGFQLHVANRIGEDTPIRVPFGSRVLNLKYEVDYSEIVTALYGHGKGEEVGDGYGRRINFSSVNFSRNGVVSPSGRLYMENPNVTAQYGKDDGSPKFGRIIFEDIESASELANATYEAYLEQSRPKMLFEASVVDLGDVGIGDGVLIIRREYDVYFNARIHKLMVDLLDAENADVELGDYEHFKESKVARKTRQNNNQFRRVTSNRIQQLKEQFNDRFDGEVDQWHEDFEQALIDAHAEIQAAEVRMGALITTTRNDWTDTFDAEVAEIYRKADEDYNRIETEITETIDSTREEMEMEFNESVQNTRDYAEQQAAEKADAVRTDLETVTSGHQSMIEDLESDVMSIDDFIGSDRNTTLYEQLYNVRSDVEERISNISSWYYNLIRGTRFDEPDKYTTWSGSVVELSDVRQFRGGEDSSLNYSYIQFSEEVTLESGKVYTLSFDYKSHIVREMDLIYLMTNDGTANVNITHHNNSQDSNVLNLNTDGHWQRAYIRFTVPRDSRGELRIGTNFGSGDTTFGTFDVRLPYLTETERTQWMFHQLDNTQNVEEISRRVTELEEGRHELITRTEYDYDSDEFSGRIRDIWDTVDGYSSTVADHEDWFVTNGTNVSQTVDDVMSRAWLADIHNPNLLSFTDVAELSHRSKWGSWRAPTTGSAYSEFARFRNTSANGHVGAISPNLEIIEGETYTLTWTAFIYDDSLNHFDYCYIFTPDGSSYITPLSNLPTKELLSTPTGSYGGNPLYKYELTFTAPIGHEEASIMIGARVKSNGIDASFAFKVPKLELGGRATPYYNAYSMFNQRADSIALQVDDQESRIANFTVDLEGITGTVADIEGDMVKQSSLEITPDYAQIGSMRIDGDTVGSLLRVSPSGIDAVAEAMRLSGDLYVDGDIETLAISAIEGEFARLWADEFSAITIDAEMITSGTMSAERIRVNHAFVNRIMVQSVFANEVTAITGNFVDVNAGNIVTSGLSANVIMSSHINSSNALIEKLFSTSARIDTLISKTHFVNEIKATSIDAVHADLRSVNSEIMDTNILKADWIQGGNALLDKVFANTAMFERMMAKSGFVSTMSAITLDLHELTIWRPDGVAFVMNGMERFGHPVPLTIDIDDDVTYNNKYFETNARGAQQVAVAAGDHAGRYYNLVVGVGMRNDAQHASTRMAVIIRPQNVPAGASGWVNYVEEFTVFRGNPMQYHTLNYPMGRPTYGAMSFTIEFWRIGDSGLRNPVQLRTRRSWVSA